MSEGQTSTEAVGYKDQMGKLRGRVVEGIILAVIGLGLGLGFMIFSEVISKPDHRPQSENVDLYILDRDAATFTEADLTGKPLVVEHHGSHDAFIHFSYGTIDYGVFVDHIPLKANDIRDDLALHVSAARTVDRLFVNGRQVYAHPSPTAWSDTQGHHPKAYIIPPGVVKVGDNEIWAYATGGQTILIHDLTIGPLDGVLSSTWWADFFATSLVISAILLMAFVAVLFLVVDWPEEDRLWARSVVLLLSVWIVYNLHALGSIPGLSQTWASALSYAVSFALVAAISAYVFSRTRVSKWANRLIAALFISGTALVFGAGFASEFMVHVFGWPAEVWSKMIMAPVLTGTLIVNRIRGNSAIGPIEFVALLSCMVPLLVDGLDGHSDIMVPFFQTVHFTFYAMTWFGCVFALSMCASLATAASRSRRIAVKHNEILAATLAEREAELAVAFEKEKDLARERTLIDERQRLMRDMHDGVGGQLVSLIAQVRAPNVEPMDISRSLNAVLEDLRLIVDSLDTAGDSLGFALGAFRNRLGPKLKAAGITLAWEVDPDAANVPLGPETVLQILRILQEACSNAIQHSGADTITVGLERSSAGDITLDVRDNGSGVNPEAPRGKGISTMQHRATRIQGDVTLLPGDTSGTTVRLTLQPEAFAAIA